MKSLAQPLILHREHGGNQSSTMRGVVDRESYRRIRVDLVTDAVRWLTERFPAGEKLQETLYEGLQWMEARQQYLRGSRQRAKMIWRYRKFAPMASLFEIAMPYMPEPLFKLAVWASVHNYI